MKDPRMVALLSLIFTGMGQMYNGQMLKGALFSIVQLINISMIPLNVGLATAPIFALYAAYDAFRVADLLLLQEGKPAAQGKPPPDKSTRKKEKDG